MIVSQHLQRLCLFSNLLTLARTPAGAPIKPVQRSVAAMSSPRCPFMLHRPERILSLLNPVLPSAGLYQAMPGLPQRGPLRRSPAVLGLLPAASHETFKLVRLPAALRLISAHLLTDWRLRWPTVPNVRIVRGSVDNRRGNYCCFFFFVFFNVFT